MNSLRRTIVITEVLLCASLASIVSGCLYHHSELVDYASDRGRQISRAPADKALIVFVRPGLEAFAAQSVVFEDDHLVAPVVAEAYVEHLTTPGRHRYMVVGKAANFLDADLAAGKIYFAEVHFGSWSMHFTLEPITPTTGTWRKLPDWLADSYRTTANWESTVWVRDNDALIKQTKTNDLPGFLSDPDKSVLRPTDGVDNF